MSTAEKVIDDIVGTSPETMRNFAFTVWVNSTGGEGYKAYAVLRPLLGYEDANHILREAFMAGVDFEAKRKEPFFL